jgi:hypothetical protein
VTGFTSDPEPRSSRGTSVLERPELSPTDGDGELRTHIIRRPDDRQSAEAWVTEARIMGFEVEAICGFRWVPARDPERYPVCEACKDLLSHMQ